MKKLLSVLLFALLLFSCAVAEEASPYSTEALKELKLGDLISLRQKIDDILAEKKAENAAKVVAELDVKPVSVEMDVNSAGTLELEIVFKNNSDSITYDRIDFIIRCYDVYGDLIKPYGIYSQTACFYDDQIRPGKKTGDDYYWSIFGVDGARNVEIAIERYHTTDGNSVTIPESDLTWIRF